jgi:hypothetical protein
MTKIYTLSSFTVFPRFYMHIIDTAIPSVNCCAIGTWFNIPEWQDPHHHPPSSVVNNFLTIHGIPSVRLPAALEQGYSLAPCVQGDITTNL